MDLYNQERRREGGGGGAPYVNDLSCMSHLQNADPLIPYITE